MTDWKSEAICAVMCAQADPEYSPRYRVTARRWWQLWKPRWRWIEGVSENDMRRAHGLPPRITYVRVRPS